MVVQCYQGCLVTYSVCDIHGHDSEANETLPQVKEFKYLGVLFTNERKGKTEKEISRRIGAAGVVLQSLNRTIVM